MEGAWSEKGGECRKQRSHYRPREEEEREQKERWARRGEKLGWISLGPVIGEEEREGKALKVWRFLHTWTSCNCYWLGLCLKSWFFGKANLKLFKCGWWLGAVVRSRESSFSLG